MAKRGHPPLSLKYNEKMVKFVVTVTKSQRQFLLDKYGKLSKGARSLIDADRNGWVSPEPIFTAETLNQLLALSEKATAHGLDLAAVLDAAIADQLAPAPSAETATAPPNADV